MSRSVKLFAVAILTILLAASMFSLASAPEPDLPISVHKDTTNGDTTTLFHFTLSSGSSASAVDLAGGDSHGFNVMAGTFILRETVPSGWALEKIECGILLAEVPGGGVYAAGSFGVASYEPQYQPSTWEVNLADHSVTIVLVVEDYVACTFTNSPAQRVPVGGFIEPINTLAIAAPYLALFGVIAAIAIVVVKPWKKRDN